MRRLFGKTFAEKIIAAKGRKATIVVRVGNNRPDLGVNPICNR